MSASLWSLLNNILSFTGTPNYKVGVRRGAELKPRMLDANQLQWIVRRDEGNDVVHSNQPWKVLKWRAWLETNEKEGLKSCKEWWKILIRHLRQLAKLLVFPKCWSVSCSVSLRLKVLKKTVSEALENDQDGEWNGGHRRMRSRLSQTRAQNKRRRRRKRKGKGRKWTCVMSTYPPLQGPVSCAWSTSCPLLAALWLRGLAQLPLGSVHDRKFGQKIFSLPYNISFHLQPQAGPGFPFGARNIKTWGHRLTRRALLSITASPSLLPFTPGSWTHRCQPGNNRQTIEAWKPGLDTLLATYLLLLAAVEA